MVHRAAKFGAPFLEQQHQCKLAKHNGKPSVGYNTAVLTTALATANGTVVGSNDPGGSRGPDQCTWWGVQLRRCGGGGRWGKVPFASASVLPCDYILHYLRPRFFCFPAKIFLPPSPLRFVRGAPTRTNGPALSIVWCANAAPPSARTVSTTTTTTKLPQKITFAQQQQ